MRIEVVEPMSAPSRPSVAPDPDMSHSGQRISYGIRPVEQDPRSSCGSSGLDASLAVHAFRLKTRFVSSGGWYDVSSYVRNDSRFRDLACWSCYARFDPRRKHARFERNARKRLGCHRPEAGQDTFQERIEEDNGSAIERTNRAAAPRTGTAAPGWTFNLLTNLRSSGPVPSQL